MKTKLKYLPAVFALAGVAVFTILLVYSGAGLVLKALASVNALGFGKYILAQLGILLGLGLCWRLILRSRHKGSYWLCVWGRAVRDATGEFLPFSQVGGLLLGARVLSLHGVEMVNSLASTMGDVTTEFLSQLVFVAIGLVILAQKVPGSALLVPVTIGLCVAVALGVALIFAQRGTGTKLFRALTMKIAGAAGGDVATHIDNLQGALDGIYAARQRLALAALAHLGSWFGTATASYVGFHALGVPLSFTDAICIEAMLHAIMALAFFIPGRVGIQEAAYTVLGGMFGIPPEISLSLSLLRRARDFVVAVPVLLAWQGLETKRLKSSLRP